MGRVVSGRSRVRCDFCGERVDPWCELRYTRLALGAPSFPARGLQHCSECKRRGCPACLQVVEERTDDFFFDRFACRGCLKGPRP